jgi:hypothetical protein
MGIEVILSKGLMNSGMSLDQLEEMTEEDQNNIMMIGGIWVFLPLSLVEVRSCVAEVA